MIGLWRGNGYSSDSVGIYPSDYCAIKTATTIIAGQSEKLASNTKCVYVKNLDTANAVAIGLGMSYTDAEASASTKSLVVPALFEANFAVATNTHVAWIGIGNTVSAIIGHAGV